MKKAIASIINKITKVSVSTALFWFGCFVAVLAAGLQWIMPGNQLVLFLVAVGGVVLAGSQKVFGDREHDRKFEQERRIRGAREQYIYASKMIMRPEQKTEEQLDPWPEQTDCRYAEGPLRESEPGPENAVPHRRAAPQKCCDDDYESRPVARYARAIQCGWRPDHRPAYTRCINAPETR